MTTELREMSRKRAFLVPVHLATKIICYFFSILLCFVLIFVQSKVINDIKMLFTMLYIFLVICETRNSGKINFHYKLFIITT